MQFCSQKEKIPDNHDLNNRSATRFAGDGCRVSAVSHQNLLSYSSLISSGFTIGDAAQAAARSSTSGSTLSALPGGNLPGLYESITKDTGGGGVQGRMDARHEN